MPTLAYGASAYKRTNGDLPELVLKNMFVESAKTSEGGVALQSRKGLEQRTAIGTGPINGIFAKAGCLLGDVFAISGAALYREAALLGTIAGTGPASFAGSETEVVTTRGGPAYSYNGTTLAAVSFPDSASVRDCCYIGSKFVYVRDASGRVYWSSLLDGRTIDGLDYFTAEREADQLLAVRPLGDNIWLFGQATIETWADTGEVDLPFTRFEQVAFDKGIRATGCVAAIDNSLAFVGSDNRVYRIGEVPQRVSDHGIEERIAASATCSVFAYTSDGHEFLCVRLDTATLAMDMATGEWCENASHASANWIAACAAMDDAVAVFGHGTNGTLMTLGGRDDLGADMVREFTAAQQIDQPSPLHRVKLWCNAGSTDITSGQGSDPTVELFTSDDAGHTWESQGAESFGTQGNYRTAPEWRAMGTFDFPGVMLKFRMSDQVDFRVSAVKVNEPGSGRSR